MTTLSLLTPTGELTLGNHLGALRQMHATQAGDTCYFGVADLHALTMPRDPAVLRTTIRRTQTLLLASGLEQSVLFRQSQVPTHAELAFLLECTATTGELNRMIQFKEKGRGNTSTRASLFTYPALMAADILLYRPERVPVGADQRQHIELTRDLALRFNHDYAEVFTVPEIVVPTAGARVMNLQEPTRKMSKSATDLSGVIRLLDEPAVIKRKVARAVTDSEVGPDAVRADRDAKPGVTNLLEILTACGGSAEAITSYGALKSAVTEAVIAELEPLQRRYAELSKAPDHVDAVFAEGAATCMEVTHPVLSAARAGMGL
ncbi:tryptophan--tRNA ligase [Nocardioides sp. Bht2]|uniref:tryptophan--tRNA ligase n=1 Tax=Nocardioides sp. Bht2 TaxID=3392297 RepID=UPI0039B3ACEE